MPRRLLKELERRNVLKVAAAYLVAAWLIAQVADLALESFAVPDWAMQTLLISLAIGFPVALAISWTFEVTSKGVIPETKVDRTVKISDQSGRRVDGILLVIVAVVIVFMGLERFVFSKRVPAVTTLPTPTGSVVANQRQPAGTVSPQRSVAVLPFAVLSTGPDDEYFAAALTGEVIDALDQSSDLLVSARTSAFHFKDRNLPIGAIANALGVAHVVEGSVRRAGDRLGVTAQLLRASDGFRLWSETYDTRTADTFQLQADITAGVAAALGVVMDTNLQERMEQFDAYTVEAFIAMQKGIELHERARAEPNRVGLLRQANAHFEEAIAGEPRLADAYQYHANLHRQVLVSTAAGELDAEIVAEDVARAPERLQSDYVQAIRHARSRHQRVSAEFGRALALGDWRGLSLLSEQAATTSGCVPAEWLHLVTPLIADSGTLLEAYRQWAACDPLRHRSHVHTTGTLLWRGAADRAVTRARQALETVEHPSLVRLLALALAYGGQHSEADEAAVSRIRAEDELLRTRAQLAAIRGDGVAALDHATRLFGLYGPDDGDALMLAAARGDRVEANRLAAAIDARPFGHLVLLEAIHACLCGPPFDLESAPVFAGLLSESGLLWPPAKPFALPLKQW